MKQTMRQITGLIMLLMMAGAVQAADYYVDITNKTGYTIVYLHVSPGKSTSWEEDVLGKDVLPNGASRRVNLYNYSSPLFDIRLTDSDGDTYTFFDVDVSRRDLVVTLDDIDGATAASRTPDYYLDVTNRTNYTMMFLQVSPASSTSWEEDVLGSDVLQPGATKRVNLYGYNDPTFDVRLTDEDGDTYTFFGINVARQDLTVTIADIDTAQANTSEYYLNVTNRTDYTMMFLQVSPSTSTSWEEDVLGSDVLRPGATKRVNLYGYSDPTFDVRLTDEDGDTYTFYKINVARQDLTVTIGDLD